MKNQIKYFLRFYLTRLINYLLAFEILRILIANSEFFIGLNRLEPMLKVWEVSSQKDKNKLVENFYISKSQFSQDLFVLLALNFLKGGYYVEFGAADGIELSNTYILEKQHE